MSVSAAASRGSVNRSSSANLWAIAQGLEAKSVGDSHRKMPTVVDKEGKLQKLEEEPVHLDAFHEQKQYFDGHTDAVKAMCVDHATSRLYTASWDETVAVWNIPTQSLIGYLPHNSWVNAVCLTQGKGLKLAATGAEDGHLTFWSASELLVIHQLRPAFSPITHLYAQRDIVFAASVATVFAVNASTGTVIREYKEKVDVVSVAANDDLLYCGMADGRILCKEIVGGFVLRELAGHKGEVRCIVPYPGANLLCTGGDDGRVMTWAISTGHKLDSIHNHRKPVTSVGIHFRDGEKFLYSGSLDGTLRCTRLAMMQSAVLRSALPNCLVVVGGPDSSKDGSRSGRSKPQPHPGVTRNSLELSMSVTQGPGSPAAVIVKKAQLLVGDYTGAIQCIGIEAFEENLKVLPAPPKLSDAGMHGTGVLGGSTNRNSTVLLSLPMGSS